MVEFAKFKFYWGGKQSDGATLQQHVGIAKQSSLASLVLTDQTFEDSPREVSCPVEVTYIWDWFIQLDAVSQTESGRTSITHQEITAWSDRWRLDVTPFETKAIREIDKAFMEYLRSKD